MASESSDYGTAVGFIQFPVNEREYNGETVRDFVIKTPGSEGALLRCTVWPEYEAVELRQGDFVAVDGKVSVREAKGNTYTNMNVKKLAIVAASISNQPEVVNAASGSGERRF